MRAFVCLLLATAIPWGLHARSPADLPGDRLLALDAGQIQQALAALQQRHVATAALDETGLARATLAGLLQELQPGAELTGGEDPEPAAVPFHSEVLDGRIGYVRLGSLRTENLAQLDAALGTFSGGEIAGVILDLRGTPETRNFPLAAEAAGRFTPAGTPLFSLQARTESGSKKFASATPIHRGVLVVLVDSSTRGAPEALAAALRRHAGAMLVGTTTGGRAVEFADLPLGSGQFLRLAVAEVRVDGLPPLYPAGIVPDLEVPENVEVREALARAAAAGSVASLVFEQGRAQMNEAALMAGTNPDLEEVTDEETRSPRLFDRALQRAVDLVTAIRVLRPGS